MRLQRIKLEGLIWKRTDATLIIEICLLNNNEIKKRKTFTYNEVQKFKGKALKFEIQHQTTRKADTKIIQFLTAKMLLTLLRML